MSRMTKSHPVARAMKAGKSMSAAWAAYRGGGVRRRNGKRRGGRRNPLIATLSNPFGGSIGSAVGKIPVIGKPLGAALNKENIKKGATIGVTIAGAMLVPTYLIEKGYIPSTYYTGWRASVATGLAGVAVATAGGMVLKGSLATGLAAAAGAVILQVLVAQGKSIFGLGDFLTQANGRMGQVPAGLIGDFMTVKKPFAALPGGGLGSGQRFSNVF